MTTRPVLLLLSAWAACSLAGCARFTRGAPEGARDQPFVEIANLGCSGGGYCRIYDVHFFQDGVVTFRGTLDVRCLGTYWRTLRDAEIAAVAEEIRRADPMSVPVADYPVSDGLQLLLVSRLDGTERRLRFQPDVDPPDLMGLVERLEAIAGVQRLSESWPRYRGQAPGQCP